MKKNMMRTLSMAALMLLGSLKSTAQVHDVSFIASPAAEYIWWDKDLSIDNMPLYGGKLGFGFGPLFELHAFYLRGDNVNAKVRSQNWLTDEGWAGHIRDTKMDLTKYGGEMRLNLGKNSYFAPFLTAGAGVQQMKYNSFTGDAEIKEVPLKDEQLFVSLGVGAKINLSSRAVLSLEAKNTMFNASKGSYLMRPEYNKEDGGNHLYNWGAAATLDFYLGGRAENSDNAVSREYRKLFSSGFKGMKFVVEPAMAYMNFDKDMALTDTYLAGGSAGFDFSSLVGIRGFYYQANKDADKLSLSFNKNLALYGGNIITRLNFPRGINPYLQLGGGYMRVGDKYADKHGNTDAESAAFAFGGAGVEIPLSRYVALFGSANAVFTAQKGVEEEDIQNPDHINTSVMYNAGLRFNLGLAADGERKYKRNLNRRLDDEREASNERLNELRSKYDERISDYDDQIASYDEKIADYDDQIAKYDERVNKLKAEYEARIDKLDKDLDKALKANDTIRVAEIARMKDRHQQELESIQNDEMAMKRKLVNELGENSSSKVKMTRSQLNDLVSRITREARQSARSYDDGYDYDYNYNNYNYEMPQQPTRTVVPMQRMQPVQNNAETEQLRKELRIMNEKLNKVISQRNAGETTVVYEGNGATGNQYVPGKVDDETAGYHPTTGKRLKLNRLGIITGLGFGDLTAWNFGVRGYMQIGSTNLDFVPELYAAMANDSGMGISGNVIYNFKSDALGKFIPYAGLGLGVFHGDDTHFGSNIILGVSVDMLSGRVFLDYSARSLTKQNQVALGYSFTF